MEFGVLRGIVDTKSYLNIDDWYGPGNYSYKKITNIPSCDFALYKIKTYSVSDVSTDRRDFVKELPLTIKELGCKGVDFIIPLLTSIYSNETQQEVLTEFINQLPQSPYILDVVIGPYLEIVRTLALDPRSSVSMAMIENIPKIVLHLHKTKVDNEIVSIALSMVLDRSNSEITAAGLTLLKSLVKPIGAELVERYFYREIIEIAADKLPALTNAILEIISELFETPKSENLKPKLLDLFLEICESDNQDIKKNCIKIFPIIIKHSTKQTHDNLLPVYSKFLKDKSKHVREAAVNNCCMIIIFFQANLPEIIVKKYFGVTETGFYNAAYYFFAVLLTLSTSYWEDLKKLFMRLIEGDVKTRISLVYSLHEIAKIIGPERSAMELITIYDTFLKYPELQLDAYANLPLFLKEVFPEHREKYISLIKSIAKDSYKWRKRYVFSRSISNYIGVYDYNCVYSEIWPLALELCEDVYAKVRYTASKEVAKLSVYLLSKNPDWKRYILMCIKKYAIGSVNNKLIFLSIVKNLADTELASDFSQELAKLACDKFTSIRIMCAETVNLSKDEVWKEAKNALVKDSNKDVLAKLGKYLDLDSKKSFIVPPLMRYSYKENIKGIIKFYHNFPPKFGKIHDYVEVLNTK